MFQVPFALASMELEAEELAKINAGLEEVECATEDEIIETAKDADALLVVFAPITRHVIEALPKLRVIVRYGIGYDTIDVDAATDNGVLLVNIPDFCLECFTEFIPVTLYHYLRAISACPLSAAGTSRIW
ncbi:hypothetical protein ES705_23045 [subsurface metagenome]